MRPLASFLHRSGIFSYLRRAWRGDDTALRQELESEITRRVAEATGPLALTVSDLRKRQGDLRRQITLLNVVLQAETTRPFERHPHARDVRAAAAPASAAIAAAALDPQPMPHLVVRDIFPEATYRALIDAIPPDECFPERDPIKQNFRPSQGKLVPAFTAAMWTLLEDDLIPGALTPALVARFAAHIAAIYEQRYGALGRDVAALPHHATAGRLMLRRPGYHLDPHLDPKRVIVTCLLYFARPGDDATFGTQLFAVDGLGGVDQSKTYYPGHAGHTCRLAATVPFTPNTAVAFLNAGAAAHGATIPASAPADTKRYAYQFYVSPDPARLAALTGETADDFQETRA